MEKQKKHLSKKTKSRVINFVDGIITAAGLMFIMMATAMVNGDLSSDTYFFIAYLMLAGSKIMQAISSFKKDKLNFYKNICFAAIF